MKKKSMNDKFYKIKCKKGRSHRETDWDWDWDWVLDNFLHSLQMGLTQTHFAIR